MTMKNESDRFMNACCYLISSIEGIIHESGDQGCFPTDCSPKKTNLYLRRVGVVVLVVLLLAGVFDSSIPGQCRRRLNFVDEMARGKKNETKCLQGED